MTKKQLQSKTHYFSASKGELVPIAWMPIPHAQHALRKVVAEHGGDNNLARALQARIDQAGDVTEVAPNADTRMMRGEKGTFTGAIKINRRKRES